MVNSPLVSIIIPTFNREKWVGKAIKSALEQNYANKEIIVVDDGSDDNSKQIVSDFPEVKYLFQKNKGQASARNLGLRHASGKYIASLDSDDEWEPNFLSESVNMLEENGLDFVFSNWYQECEDGKFRDYYFHIYRKIHPSMPTSDGSWIHLSYKELREIFTNGCPAPSSSLVLRSSILTNGWNEEMTIADDWFMLLEIIFSKEVKVAFTTKCLWKKSIGSNNLVDGRDKQEVFKILWVNDIQRIITYIRSHLQPTELKNMKKLYIKGLLVSAHFSLRRNSNYKESIHFLKTAMIESPLRTPRIFLNLIYKSIKNNNPTAPS